MSIRLARISDIGKIKELSRRVNYLSGLDFVPAYVKYWMENPRCYPFVHDDGNKIGGFFVCMVLPGAGYASHFGGRVSEQGKGIGQLGQRYSVKYLHKLYPAIDRMVSSRVGLPLEDKLPDSGSAKFAGSQAKPEPQRILNFQVYTLRDFESALRRKGAASFGNSTRLLRPQDKLDVRVIESVLRILLQEGSYFFGAHTWMSLKCDAQGIGMAFQTSDVIVTQSEVGVDDFQGVSFAGHHEVSDGTKLDIMYYGNNIEELVEHTIVHLCNYEQAVKCQHCTVFVRFPITLSYTDAELALSKILGDRSEYSKKDIRCSHIFTNTFLVPAKV